MARRSGVLVAVAGLILALPPSMGGSGAVTDTAAAAGAQVPTRIVGWSTKAGTVTVRSAVTARVTVRTGRGTVRRAVLVQRRVAGTKRWATAARLRTAANGRLRARLVVPSARRWQFRLSVPATRAARAAVTRPRTLTGLAPIGATPAPLPGVGTEPTPAPLPAPDPPPVDPGPPVGTTERLSVRADGSQIPAGAFEPAWSPDGTKVAFVSAQILTQGDGNNSFDVFVKDLTTGQIRMVSESVDTIEGSAQSRRPLFSPDGTRILFTSFANNLVALDTNDIEDVFIKDLRNGAVTRVSTTSTGQQATDTVPAGNIVMSAAWSPDGNRVAFSHFSPNLASPASPSGIWHVYVKDLATGTTTRVSVTAAGALPGDTNGLSAYPAFSPDGTRVAFSSGTEDLMAGDNNGNAGADIYVKTLAGGALERASVPTTGAHPATGASTGPAFSPDGSKVAFYSTAPLAPGDADGATDVYVRTLGVNGSTTRITTPLPGITPNPPVLAGTDPVAFSPDGSRVAFSVSSNTLVAGDTNNNADVFVAPSAGGVITRVSTSSAGAQALGGHSSWPTFSPDGRWVLFQSGATDLVGGDSNGGLDVFRKRIQ